MGIGAVIWHIGYGSFLVLAELHVHTSVFACVMNWMLEGDKTFVSVWT